MQCLYYQWHSQSSLGNKSDHMIDKSPLIIFFLCLTISMNLLFCVKDYIYKLTFCFTWTSPNDLKIRSLYRVTDQKEDVRNGRTVDVVGYRDVPHLKTKWRIWLLDIHFIYVSFQYFFFLHEGKLYAKNPSTIYAFSKIIHIIFILLYTMIFSK